MGGYTVVQYSMIQTFTCHKDCPPHPLHFYLDESPNRGLYYYLYHHANHTLEGLRLPALIMDLEEWRLFTVTVVTGLVDQRVLSSLLDDLRVVEGHVRTQALDILFQHLPSYLLSSTTMKRYNKQRAEKWKLLNTVLPLIPDLILIIYLFDKDTCM